MNKPFSVLVGVPWVEAMGDVLGSSLATVDVEPFIVHNHLVEVVGKYDALVVGPVTCDEPVFEAAKGLKCISTAGTGHDNIDLKAATEQNVAVANVPGTMSESVAELTIGRVVIREVPRYAAVEQNPGSNRPGRLLCKEFERLVGVIDHSVGRPPFETLPDEIAQQAARIVDEVGIKNVT